MKYIIISKPNHVTTVDYAEDDKVLLLMMERITAECEIYELGNKVVIEQTLSVVVEGEPSSQ